MSVGRVLMGKSECGKSTGGGGVSVGRVLVGEE